MRHVLVFFALGALLLTAKRQLLEPGSADAARPLTVHVTAQADEAEVERAIDEAVLVEEALLITPVSRDPVVRAHLIAAALPLSGARANDSDERLVARALELGLHHADPVIRQRLAFQMEQLLAARLPPASDDELQRFFEQHKAKYTKPRQTSFTQLFFSRAKHGAGLERHAAELLAKLRSQPMPLEAALALADPTLLPRSLAAATDAAIDARFGHGFAAAIARSELGAWFGPVLSSYGLHLVHVDARGTRAEPFFSQVRATVSADYDEQRRRQVVREQTLELRASYRIDLVRGR
jgi:hypothetical protein